MPHFELNQRLGLKLLIIAFPFLSRFTSLSSILLPPPSSPCDLFLMEISLIGECVAGGHQ